MLIDYSTLKKFDPSEIHKTYDNWPDIALNSYESSQADIKYENIDHIVFAGMGGSGALCDIFEAILSKSNIHVCVVKGYHLPSTVDSNTLVVTVSISGNTMETLTVLDSAKKTGCKTIAFSSGGKMEKYCKNNQIKYQKIPQLHSPRASFTAYLYSLLGFMSPVIPIKKVDIIDSIKKLETLQKRISSNNITRTNPSLSLAQWITGIPAIYYPWGLQAAAIRFKNSLQENAKIHAMAEDIVEMCHNGIVAWGKKSIMQPILIQGTDDYVKTKEVWKILKLYFKENNIDYWEIVTTKGSILTKLINLIYLLDYASIYLAVLNKRDPSPTLPINFMKEHMSRFSL